MITLLAIKEGIFTLEVCQSQVGKDCYFVVVKNLSEAVRAEEFNDKEVAIKRGKAMIENIAITARYRNLADTAYQKALFAEEDGQEELKAMYLRKAKFYEQRYLARQAMLSAE
jgi:ABC-type ATPase with predicted acetyltransferase domain